MKLWPTLLMGLVATGAQSKRSHERTRRQYDLTVSTIYLMQKLFSPEGVFYMNF